MNRSLKFGGVLVASVAGLYLLFSAFGFTSSSASSEQAQIKDVVTKAIRFDHTMTSIPSTYSAVYGQGMPQSVQDAIINRDTAKAMSIYSPSSQILATRLMLIRRDLGDEANGDEVNLGGGIDGPITFNSIVVDGNSASVSCQATVWAEARLYHDGHGVTLTPRNTVNYTFTLQDINGQWLVSGESIAFAPGSEP